MELNRTKHGEQQHQRRATLGLFEDLLLDHGSRVRSHGADIVFLDKEARRSLSKSVGGKRGMRILERYCNSYLVVADNSQVITTGHRTRRVRRR